MDLSQLARSVRTKVNQNDHGGAYLMIAEAIGDNELAQAFARINKEYMRTGHLPFELYEVRHMLYLQLMHKARKHFGEETFQRLHSAL